jgi:hypothetical protein
MSLSTVLLLAVLTPAVPTDDPHHDRVFTGASQLVSWCRAEAEARVVAEGGTPYQWTASHSERGKVLEVKGTLRVDGEPRAVTCRVARGASERYASIAIDG